MRFGLHSHFKPRCPRKLTTPEHHQVDLSSALNQEYSVSRPLHNRRLYHPLAHPHLHTPPDWHSRLDAARKKTELVA